MTASLRNYLNQLLNKDVLRTAGTQTNWAVHESFLAGLYRGILRAFLADCHIPWPEGISLPQLPLSPYTSAQLTSVRLGALNFRGLYRRNGRETLLEPCGSFLPRCSDTARHRTLHHIYMQLVRKAESINQLFLSTTTLDTLSVQLCAIGGECTAHHTDGKHATIVISEQLCQQLAGKEVRKGWSSLIAQVLAPDFDLAQVARLSKEASQTAAQHQREFEKGRQSMLQGNPYLFQQWLSIPFIQPLQSMAHAGALFEVWLRSLAWLLFYCRPEHAGGYFFTVRLPTLLTSPAEALPDSSMSIVADVPLAKGILDDFRGLRGVLTKTRATKALKAATKFQFDAFLNRRRGDLAEELASALGALSPPLSLNYDGVAFLCKVARCLVGQRHEGHPLRFCFVFGFSRERLDAEAAGVLREVSSELSDRWPNFTKALSIQNAPTDTVGEALASWIKSNDLQLQRMDTAVFFEEREDCTYPVPVSIVRVRFPDAGEYHTVGTEIQLRAAFRKLSTNSKTTVCVVTAPTGLYLFAVGKCFLIPCSARDRWNDPVHAHLWDKAPLEDKIRDFTENTLRSVFVPPAVSEEVLMEAAAVLTQLFETLVTLGHGALFVVRTPQKVGEPSPLAPLNPVWCLRPSVSLADTERDCATYALMAALDGATEVILPRSGSEILFSCRRFAQISLALWEDVPGGYAGEATVNTANSKVPPLSLVGKGTRHHSALALSRQLGSDALIITVSADGPVTFWRDGDVVRDVAKPSLVLRYAP